MNSSKGNYKIFIIIKNSLYSSSASDSSDELLESPLEFFASLKSKINMKCKFYVKRQNFTFIQIITCGNYFVSLKPLSCLYQVA